MLVTVATPTYNRASLLPRLYQSLCSQTCSDFEWIVVDDGSTDKTQEVVDRFIKEAEIPIRYIRKENGGKHTAVNVAANEAQGELFFIADSDDWLTGTAIEEVIQAFTSIRDDKNFAGICGLDEYADGTIVGSGLPKTTIDATPQEIREVWHVRGDLKEVFRTEIMRKFAFPEIPGERFCPEILVWNRISRHYKLRYFNRPIYMVEYQPDGLTSGITRARMKSPIASMMTYSEWFDMLSSTKLKLRMAINYWRFYFCSKANHSVRISGWGNLLMPAGGILHIKDRLTIK